MVVQRHEYACIAKCMQKNPDDKHKTGISSLSTKGFNINKSPKKGKLVSQKFSGKRLCNKFGH